MPPPRSLTIYIVSDGRGNTALELVRASLVQFGDQPVRKIVKSKVRQPEQIQAIFREAAQQNSIIFYTLVSSQTRNAMEQGSREHLVPIVDLLGPALTGLHDLFETQPDATPGLFYASDRRRFDRIEAVNFAMTHDDGQRPHELPQADVVLVGVSRASKSSTCMFLAMDGLKAANVPLVMDCALPPVMEQVDPHKVIGLVVSPVQLMAVRGHRAKTMGIRETDPYLDKREIGREIRFANELMERRGWRSVQTTYRAIEEIASEVIRMLDIKPDAYGRWD